MIRRSFFKGSKNQIASGYISMLFFYPFVFSQAGPQRVQVALPTSPKYGLSGDLFEVLRSLLVLLAAGLSL